MSDLIDRYVGAVARSVPLPARPDLTAELRASISDQLDARLEAGENPSAAERAVLTELGDPAILAAQYADRPLHLIGPRYYRDWVRLLKLLLWIVPVGMALSAGLGHLLNGGTADGLIGPIVSAVLNAVVHVGFWVTLVFFILERTGHETMDPTPWNPDKLPLAEDRRKAFREVIASFAFVGITAILLVWDATIGFIPWGATGGEPLPILHPMLLPWSIVGGIALTAVRAVIALSVFRAGRWTWPAAVVDGVLAVVTGGLLLALLVTGRLLNPAFVAFALPLPDGPLTVLTVLLGCVIGLGALWSIADVLGKAHAGAPLGGRRRHARRI